MAARGTVAGRRRRGGPGNGSETLLALLWRALGLERAALLVESEAGRLEPLALHDAGGLGAPRPDGDPAGGPWSLSLPLRLEGRRGLLLLDRGGGAPLASGDRALAERAAALVACVVDERQVAGALARTRALLRQADRLSALGTLAAGVAHEIRNPLVSVRTFIQLLPERLTDEEFRTGFRDLALGEIERICGLINDLLAFSRPAPPEREPTDLNEVVGQIVRLLDAEARRRDVAISCRVDERLPPVIADDAQVKQVLMNVVLNAIQACGAGGSVEIATLPAERAGEAWGVVTVADSGEGIAAEHIERIFDPFFTTKDGGSGLGLYIAREIVGGHDGLIEVSARAGGGTAFSIHLPARPRESQADASAV